MGCGGARARCVHPRIERAPRRFRARVALAAIAIAALLAGAYGERWVLRDAPLPALEYVVATCAALAVQDGQPSGACNSKELVSERANHE
jgi:hypothetical protein